MRKGADSVRSGESPFPQIVKKVGPDLYELGTITLDTKARKATIPGRINMTQQQYVEAGLLVFDPLAPNNERYRLAPLGLEFDIEEPLAPDPKQPGEKYPGEHVVEASFLELYEALGGTRYVGLPLTDTRYNPERHRTEQYFENLGFFRPEEETGREVRLMAYGAYACNRRCRYQSPNNSIPGERNVLLAPFDLAVRKIGWDITGRVLVRPKPG